MKKLFCLLLILFSTQIFGAFEVYDFDDGSISIASLTTDNNAALNITRDQNGLSVKLMLLDGGKFTDKKDGEEFHIKIEGDKGTELAAEDYYFYENGTIINGDDVINVIKKSNYIDIIATRNRDGKEWNFRFSCAGYTKNIGKVKEKK